MNNRTLGEKFGDALIQPWFKFSETVLATALFTLTGVLFSITHDLFMTSVYVASLFVIFLTLRYSAHKAEQRRLAKAKETTMYHLLTYARSSEVISPAQFSLLSKLNSILKKPSNEEKGFMNTFIAELLEDLTTRVFEADVRASKANGKSEGQSFKATLMVRKVFGQQEFEELSKVIDKENGMTDAEKENEKRKYQVQVGKQCIFIKHWYYPGNAHPDSLGIPYLLNEGVAGLSWFKKSLVIWTPAESCTPRFVIKSNTFAEKYRGQQEKFSSMVCVPVEKLDKNGTFLFPSDQKADGVLGVLTITCERNEYMETNVDFAKYLQTLLAPYVTILSYALERV